MSARARIEQELETVREQHPESFALSKAELTELYWRGVKVGLRTALDILREEENSV